MCRVSLIYKKWCQDLFTHIPLSFRMSCMLSGLNNHPKKAFYILLYQAVQKVHCLMLV